MWLSHLRMCHRLAPESAKENLAETWFSDKEDDGYSVAEFFFGNSVNKIIENSASARSPLVGSSGTNKRGGQKPPLLFVP